MEMLCFVEFRVLGGFVSVVHGLLVWVCVWVFWWVFLWFLWVFWFLGFFLVEFFVCVCMFSFLFVWFSFSTFPFGKYDFIFSP